MIPKKTHRQVKNPSITGRFLADYMAASDIRRRSILRGSKYPPIARVLQHDHAKTAISHFFVTGGKTNALKGRADALRSQMADDDFGRDLLDFNADYIERFADRHPNLELPKGEILAPGPTMVTSLSGVKVTLELAFRMRRPLKDNKAKIGGAMLRYAKNKPLDLEVAKWQSPLLHGILAADAINDNEFVDPKMCLTIDAQVGVAHVAPGDSPTRFKNMHAALTTIGELWANIPEPSGAVF